MVTRAHDPSYPTPKLDPPKRWNVVGWIALLGPRQCGKTTLARQIVPAGAVEYFELENPRDLARLDEPMSALEPLRGIVVIDEVQRRPDLFPVLRVLVDRAPLPARFIILGSASPALLRQSSESLAGRIERVNMGGFTLGETGQDTRARHWLRGGFPLSLTACSSRCEWLIVMLPLTVGTASDCAVRQLSLNHLTQCIVDAGLVTGTLGLKELQHVLIKPDGR